VVVVAVTAVLVVVFTRSPAESPNSTPVYVIAIDAGHGGRDPGATSGDAYEKDINLQLANKVVALIDADPMLEAAPTRTLDVYVPLEDRIQKAEDAGAIVYVSIHVNSFTSPDAHGVETIVDTTRPENDDSWTLAELIQSSIVDSTGARDRGTRAQESYTQRTQMPAVSVEVGYLTNPEELTQLLDPAYQDLIASGIVNGIRQFIELEYPAEQPEA
jgi:N-acetylmuramoyl-L-alanine amidase